MRVCIVGAKERDTDEDREYVGKLMRAIKQKTPVVMFVTMLTHMGVGKIVRDICAAKDPVSNRRDYNLIVVTVDVFASNQTSSEYAQIYLARNATPFELSDVLYYLASDIRRGPMEDLLQRFIDAGRPYKILYPDSPIEVI